MRTGGRKGVSGNLKRKQAETVGNEGSDNIAHSWVI